jgi:hypothetical protein
MTRTERTIVQHWRGIAVVCAIVALFGIAWATWHRIDGPRDQRYAAAAAEARPAGDAVSTLAGDVRALRQQVEAAGATPVAPDPTKAVDDLPKRAEVPVPIPGPSGPDRRSVGASPAHGHGAVRPGREGRCGLDGAWSGPSGAPGADSTVRGRRVSRVLRVLRARTGGMGRPARTVFHLQAPSWDPDALVCRKDGAPQPSGPPGSEQGAALQALWSPAPTAVRLSRLDDLAPVPRPPTPRTAPPTVRSRQ